MTFLVNFIFLLGLWFLCGLVTLTIVRIHDHFVNKPYPPPDDFEEAVGVAVILGPFGVILSVGAILWRLGQRGQKSKPRS